MSTTLFARVSLPGKAIAWGSDRIERLRAECHELVAARPTEYDHDPVDALFGDVGRAATSTDPNELIGFLRARHQTILAGRPDKSPGEWKTKPNQVGAYSCVAPELVEGTLRKGLAGLSILRPGIARALYVMLVVSEVHPFTDGNGRVARTMMNAELSAIDDARIVIPSVNRNEYISGLRRVSTTTGDIAGFLTVMVHAWRWTSAMPWTDRSAVEGQLGATNALLDSTDAQDSNLRLVLP